MSSECLSEVLPLLCVSVVCVHRFIEYGEYKENQYGTSIEAIRSVQAKNKMCLVDVQPEVCFTNLFCIGLTMEAVFYH